MCIMRDITKQEIRAKNMRMEVSDNIDFSLYAKGRNIPLLRQRMCFSLGQKKSGCYVYVIYTQFQSDQKE